MQDFCGRVAIVTGAGHSPGRVSSIGEAASLLLARRGAVLVAADISREAAEATAAAIRTEGGQAVPVVADLSNEAGCRTVVDAAVSRHGRIDILVNNVGIGSGGLVTELDEEAFDRAVAVNLKSAMFMAKLAVPRMEQGGAIVNVSSTAVQYPTMSLAYSATKAALESLTAHLAFQFGPDGVRCNTVRPGEVWTAMVDRNCSTEADAARLREERARRCVLPYDGDAWDLAEAICFLASDAARWITGQTLSVDGGAPLIRPNPEWRSHHSYWKARKPG